MEKRWIVSLTSYPKCIRMAFDVIRSLEQQTKLPDKVVLYLSKEEFPEQRFASDVIPYTGKLDFTIRWVDGNLKPHKKYFYAFQEYRNDYVITIDDDYYHPDHMIETFADKVIHYPNAVLARRAHLITKDRAGNIDSYQEWVHKCFTFVDEPRMDLIAIGCGACLYQPEYFIDEVFNLEMIKNYCLTTDDLWLKIMELLSGIPTVLVSDRLEYKEISHDGLYNMVNLNGGNDASWKKLWDFYKDYHGQKDILNEKIRIEEVFETDDAKNRAYYKGIKDFRVFCANELHTDTVYLYGAGIWANRILKAFYHDQPQIDIKSILVTNKKNNPDHVLGVKVYEIEDLESNDSDIPILVAVADAKKQEIFDYLMFHHMESKRIILLDPRTYDAVQSIVNAVSMETHRVSVIIAVYQSCCLRDCLDAVCNQTLEETEIICICQNTCLDEVRGILKEYTRQEKQIRIFSSQINDDKAVLYNIGMEHATGEYICFISCEENIKENAMEVLYHEAERNGTDMIVFRTSYFCDDITASGVNKGRQIFAQMIKLQYSKLFMHRLFFKRKSLLLSKEKFQEGVQNPEMLFFYRCLIQAERVAYIPYTIYSRQREGAVYKNKWGKDIFISFLVTYKEILKYWQISKRRGGDWITFRFLESIRQAMNDNLYDPECLIPEVSKEIGMFTEEALIFRLLIDDRLQAAGFFGRANFEKLGTQGSNYIFGAGLVAREILTWIKKSGLPLSGFLVTEMKNNPKEISGIPVYKLEDVSKDLKGGKIMIGVGQKSIPEVTNFLKKNGIADFMILPRYLDQNCGGM